MISIIYDAKNKDLKSKFYDVFRPLYKGQPLNTVFTTQDVARNKRMKIALVKNMTGYSPIFQNDINSSVDIFVDTMLSMTGESIDISYWSYYWSFDMTSSRKLICNVLAGRGNSDDKDAQNTEAVNVLFKTFFAAAVEVVVTLATVFNCLLTDNVTYERLVDELRGMDPKMSKDLSVHKTSYLTAVIKELLRVYSSNAPPMERIVPFPGMEAHGHHIAEGTIVSVPQYVVHRDVEIYGQDALHFRPERWLEADESAQRRMEHNLLAFGKGSRACVGRDLAMLELRPCLMGLLRNFDIELADKDMLPKITMYWMIDQINFNVRFSPVKA